jgi:hypothetical protein
MQRLRKCHTELAWRGGGTRWIYSSTSKRLPLSAYLSCCKVWNWIKIKNTTVVLMFRFTACVGKADGENLFRNSTGQKSWPSLSSWYAVYTTVSPGTGLVWSAYKPAICFRAVFLLFTQNCTAENTAYISSVSAGVLKLFWSAAHYFAMRNIAAHT